ncbi:MAG: DEAD/DEAH box helicase family protein [Ruminococcus sp.]|nr:DEAD/DEAH box helicase family protein [Ruminococcus sp.]
MAKKKQEIVRFNDRLLLFRFFLNRFGKDTLKGLAKDLNDIEYEGYDENQNTWFYVYLKRYCKDTGISADFLRMYDENICRHLQHINEKREDKVILKYFQYISLLFTEMYLDNYFFNTDQFINDLNEYIDKIDAESLGMNHFSHYSRDNMNKLAYMCATGSGKTLIMHINILQYLHYMKRAKRRNSSIDINKIIVLAPNEGLSNQHLEELTLSSISAKLFSKDIIGMAAEKNDVLIIDINKLKEENGVKTVSIDSFEQNNLVLVDEGHRGLTGDVWYDYRTRLSADGFSFEYSATFRQALQSQKSSDKKAKEELIDEYGKAIIMDYSYKYFYEDGYGKDYRIYNLKDNFHSDQQLLYLTGCLMSFYQQIKLYTVYKKEYTPFRIEKPLLVFVGNRVTAKISDAELTDVEEILAFIDTFVMNKNNSSINHIEMLITGNTGLNDAAGNELFYNDFTALENAIGIQTAEEIYYDVIRTVFNVETTPDIPRLHIVDMKQVDGEIGLKIGEMNPYFGVISVGDTSTLIKKCNSDHLITDTEEFASESMFRTINNKDSNINILIGSRKFSEGWNSWRVSTMGLINFAKGEGSQAIQLFGRGVRLRGYDGCLKRSHEATISIQIPKHLWVLETLTIFGVKAQYMEDFKKYLEMEDVPANETTYEFILPIKSRYDMVKGRGLQVIQLPERIRNNYKRLSKRIILSVPDDDFIGYLSKNRIVVDCCSKVQTIESGVSLHIESTTKERVIDNNYLSFLNYQRIYEELQQYKNEKKYYNIIINKYEFKKILSVTGWYGLIIPEKYMILDSIEAIENITDYAIMILKVYLDKFYTFNKAKWEAPFLEYHELSSNNNNIDLEYKIKYTSNYSDDSNAEQIRLFIDDIVTMIEKKGYIEGYEMSMNKDIILAFDFRKHLYTPLIKVLPGPLKIQVSPVPLNDGEKLFVDKLHDYFEENAAYFQEKEIYLLRNKSKVGMGFFEAGNFYPDFVLWIKEENIQRISFIDPKGLLRVSPHDPKLSFYIKIKELQQRLANTAKEGTVILNSFIMSSTHSLQLGEFLNMNKLEREQKHILSLDNDDCIKRMIEMIEDDSSQIVSE